MDARLLAPVVALILWTLLVQLWLYATRIPAIRRARLKLGKEQWGIRPGGLDGVLPDRVQWKAHNYNHLLEQPVLFYATMLALAILGQVTTTNIALGWAYFGLRVAHSLVHATLNIILYRFMLFVVASIVLAALAASLALAIF